MSKVSLKTWHFLLVFAILVISSNIIWSKELHNTPMVEENSALIELDNQSFSDNVASGTCFVLFYTDESDVCTKMEQNLNQLIKASEGHTGFYKLNIDKYPGEYGKYAISGTPSTLIFKDGKEIDRIMGIVPISNLIMIYKRSI
ncbi:thioredoxin [Dysgonomonas alginatilytica]|uniref:Thioredoxin n=1 Tax=Dysgonomonas alginatilytica TaxID=1605892 RepID=A0A2V3PR97_9BACT|nr:thioredoxin family protein [Dysgonomonas alginatilytica]PXV65051.1 thioredoxin [Dysgonomonas alginatilytica]